MITQANQEAVNKILRSHPVLIDMGLAKDVIPGMTPTTVLHAGPPITWDRMCGPLKGAVIGALEYENLKLDQVQFAPAHHLGAVGPMAGVITASMPVFVIENKAFGNHAYATVNEGLGKVLRYGANGPDVIQRLRWIADGFYPALKQAIVRAKGIDLKVIIAQALHMGDECHNRNKAATSLFLRAILPHLEDKEALAFINGNDHFFLNLSMAACKASLDPAHGIPNSTIVTAMARNGTDFGIRVSGLGDAWFCGPAQHVEGLLFPGFSDADRNPDMGDSAITETFGIGGFSMAASPAIVQFIGGSPKEALNHTQSMYEITAAENSAFGIPSLGFRGAPTGIDIRKVVELNCLPIINTGIAHREPGIGMVGAGIVYPPVEAFTQALIAFNMEISQRRI